MSLFRDSPSHHSILHSQPSSSSSSTSTPIPSSASSHDLTKPQPRSSSSRNDLFTTSWQPELPPPRPLSGVSPSTSTSTSISHSHSHSLGNVPSSIAGSSLNAIFDLGGSSSSRGIHANTLPSPMRKRGEPGLKMDLDGIANSFSPSSTTTGVNEFGVTEHGIPSSIITKTSLPKLNKDDISPSPRTSSFFDTPIQSITPPPAPRLISSLNASTNGLSSFAPSPLTLSRSSSIRNVPPPLPLPSTHQYDTAQSPISGIASSSSVGSSRQTSLDGFTDPLSPLHQSPQLPPSSSSAGLEDWKPPLPPSSDDIELRLIPNSTYLLGEGRYARAYLASYRRKRKVRSNILGRSNGSVSLNRKQSLEVNEDGDGLVGGSWKLCAAKRLAPDRESQTMGLREAFFLNRLAGPSSASALSNPRERRDRSKQRAVSPLRGNSNTHQETDDCSRKRKRPCGSVYVVKLIAVKEDIEGFPSSISGNQTHTRSSSDVLTGSSADSKSSHYTSNSVDLRRQRSSTIISAHSTLPPGGDGSPFPSHPSLPSLAQSVRYEQSAPSLSRLVLLLEHAPLGTLDRMLRTSPQLVGRTLWERWAREGAEALEWVHGKGVVHADVKPGNLLLTTDLHLRLSDFGSSLLIHPAHPPTDGLGLGTLPFSPPELVDPTQTFSFPVDIFALGATLYQCLTGREPFRGIRTVEMMHHVRKGGLWIYEERERLQRVGSGEGVSTSGSPYPSAWRGYPSNSVSVSATTGAGYPSGTISNSINNPINAVNGIRRGGSLRVPPSYSSRDHLPTFVDNNGNIPNNTSSGNNGSKPKLKRMTSAESIKASDQVTNSESPSGVKLYANWVKSGPSSLIGTGTPVSNGSGNNVPTVDALTRLLSDGDEFDLTSPTYGISRGNSLRRAQQTKSSSNTSSNSNSQRISPIEPSSSTFSSLSTSIPKAILQVPTPTSPCSTKFPDNIDMDLGMETEMEMEMDAEEAFLKLKSMMEPYNDGSPAMLFLDGRERVPENIREILRVMLNPIPEQRFTAKEIRIQWDEYNVGLDEDSDDEEQGE
ncbi:uncharacterized protein IL334_000924 [Kwoniella shivajii]|uniref:Protein kinase domain-containing protein n=1 Tax=Kwoniella shivajii TaxID=564305 RepID=A0ABZ1CQI4_9TREE|nr:hypothetical protein IL334_000924 [Kwoniella shivajii]